MPPIDKVEQPVNPSQEPDLFQADAPAAAPAEDDASSYETVKGDDGAEYVKIPKNDYDELRQGTMRQDDYTRKTQTIQTFADLFEVLDEPGKPAAQPKPVQKPPVEKQQAQPTQYGKPFNPDALKSAMQRMTEQQVKQQVAPMLRKMADIELEKEEAEFKSKYAQVFVGDEKQNAAIMNKVLETTLKYNDENGSPISMERAFFVAFGGNMLGALQNVYSQQQNRKDWDTESSSLTKGGSETYRSSQDADLAVERLIRDKVGYSN
jgi:hypothetical protein